MNGRASTNHETKGNRGGRVTCVVCEGGFVSGHFLVGRPQVQLVYQAVPRVLSIIVVGKVLVGPYHVA
jgi:hypothetical protein